MVRVKIYTTPNCAYCKMAKEHFRENNIEYEEYDVSQDTVKRQEMFEKSGQIGVPVIEIDGNIVVGFDRGRVEKYLAKAGEMKQTT